MITDRPELIFRQTKYAACEVQNAYSLTWTTNTSDSSQISTVCNLGLTEQCPAAKFFFAIGRWNPKNPLEYAVKG